MELQTLKDLSDTTIECETGCFDDSKYPYVYLKDLKQEAIKWIKELEKEPKVFMEPIKGLEEFCATYDGETSNVINWIVKFFNITEEDLK